MTVERKRMCRPGAPIPAHVGAALGNWNDRRPGPGRPPPFLWRPIDKIAGWLHTCGAPR